VGRSTFKGFPGTDRESPALVREALEKLKGVYPIGRYFVGGHSQGGFLTYSLLMNSPETIAGAFPVSAGVIVQCEPSAFDDAKLKSAQRAVPLAIVHGKNDPAVPFGSGDYAARLFGDAGWPAFRLFTDDGAGHMFARLPVGPAIRWLEAMASDDPEILLDCAERRLKESAPRDAIAATRRARGLPLDLDPETEARLERIDKSIDELAAPKAETFLTAIRADDDGSWVDPFLAYRREFEFARSAAPAVAAFNALRAKHDPPARTLMGEARSLFQQGRRDAGLAKAKEVVAKYYASSSYPLAKTWLAGRN
jgi:dienelactone hydrolase